MWEDPITENSQDVKSIKIKEFIKYIC